MDDHNKENELIWTKISSSKFFGKSMYKPLANSAGSKFEVHDNKSRNVFLKFWKENNVPQRVFIFIWRCLNGALPLKSKLGKFLASCDILCPIYRTERETIDHLFLNVN